MADTGTRRRLGALAGAGISAAALPGITLNGDGTDAVLAVMLAGLAIGVLTQLIHIGPSAPVPAPALLVFGAAGFVQDSLIWWLLSWLGDETGTMRVEGIGTILLAGLITRVSILALSLVGASPATAD
ncbi:MULTISPECIES: hypothetical protein [Streptomyces]|uniref:hypothetical protein n=1 Tax=Streptomyces TaxID=1883 RepID=UPI001315AF2F|nr:MULTISPECIES: hypothetical protein [Streptomyces]QGZ49170.1 hypothetical protein GPZ77_12950 [Streptomyces sp. QHH-9511]GGT90904.1 hypothetical protein GCM10010272_39630 [Streptomyces lateritius]